MGGITPGGDNNGGNRWANRVGAVSVRSRETAAAGGRPVGPEGAGAYRRGRLPLLSRDGRVVTVLWLAMLLMGVTFAMLQPVWSRVDEAQHFHYIQYLYENRALPVEGETFISPEVVAVSREAGQWGWYPAGTTSEPTRLDPAEWTAVPQELDSHDREQWVRRNLWHFNYEAMQPPLYYAVNVPLYAALPGDTMVKLYGMRLLAVLLASLMVPIAYLTAREAFPDSRLVTLGAPVVVLLTQGYALNMSQVTNDALATPLAAAAILALLRMVRRGYSTRRSLIAGVLIGAAMLTKMTAVFLLPVALLALLLPLAYGREAIKRALVNGALIIAPVAAIAAPWILRNISVYGDATGAAAAQPLMSSFFASPLRDMESLRINELLPTFWFGEPIFPFPFWQVAWVPLLTAMVMALVGMAFYFAHSYRLHVREIRISVVFLTLTFVLGVGINLLMPFASGIGGVPGRYLYPLLPTAAFLLLFGIDRLLRRERARFLAEAFLVWMIVWESFNLLAYIQVR